MFNYKKKLGQNFLIDDNVKNKITKFLSISKSDVVVELGAGSGNMSELLIQHVYKFFLIEIDIVFFKLLEKKFLYFNNVLIFHENCFNFNFSDVFKKYGKFKIIGNIPYNISIKIFCLLIKISRYIKNIHLIVQKEFINKFYLNQFNYVTFIFSYHYSIARLFYIKPKSFFPKPKVTSVFVKIKSKKKRHILNMFFVKKNAKFFLNKKKKKMIVIEPEVICFLKYCDVNITPTEITTDNFIRLLNLMYITKLND